jgi:hypothetical protein
MIKIYIYTFQKSRAKDLPFYFSKIYLLEKGKTKIVCPIYKKISQSFWLHLSTFQKSRAKNLKVEL